MLKYSKSPQLDYFPFAVCLHPSTLFLSLIICISVQWQFVHFHGQKTSRQIKYRSIYDNGHKRRIPFRLLSMILFFNPDAHLRELKKVWAQPDGQINERVWRDFMQKLVSEWLELILYVSYTSLFSRPKRSTTSIPRNIQSTVMLAANVAFLAIQGVVVIPSNGGWIKASPAQISSSMSLVFSIGSIITGLLLVRRNRATATQDLGTAVRWSFHILAFPY